MKPSALLLAAGCALAPILASAAEQTPYSPAYHACMRGPEAHTTIGMNACLSAEFAVQDERLNANYQTVMDSLSRERRERLRAAQRAWLAFRDLQCDFFVDPDGGTIQSIQVNDCRLAFTAQRAAYLGRLKQP